MRTIANRDRLSDTRNSQWYQWTAFAKLIHFVLTYRLQTNNTANISFCAHRLRLSLNTAGDSIVHNKRNIAPFLLLYCESRVILWMHFWVRLVSWDNKMGYDGAVRFCYGRFSQPSWHEFFYTLWQVPRGMTGVSIFTGALKLVNNMRLCQTRELIFQQYRVHAFGPESL